MLARNILTSAAIIIPALSAGADTAQESLLVLGKSTYGALCAGCHGEEAKGGGTVGELFTVQPPDLTKISERAEREVFPFADVYEVITLGMEAPGHGSSQMPVWGDYFLADAMKDRGISTSEAIFIAAGRALSLAHYLESIQE